ncbi:MAG TPA: (4Fe-4S)-binding protein, partial [Chloroflexota bacterium]|nr:(4Fe-4S)-binding protein [Chloroflexota bacterium]
GDGVATIDDDACVECGTCERAAPCPTKAIYRQPEAFKWPRSVRTAFSDPLVPHKETGVRGRGTEEVKTNDVTGRFKRGRIGMAMEFGRPGVGSDFGDVEKMTMALARIGVHFEPLNPLTFLMEDTTTGKIKDEVKGEKVLSAIVEFETEPSKLAEIVPVVREVAGQIKSVFSWCAVTRLGPNKEIPIMGRLKELGLEPRINAKVNVGLGRPLVTD